MDGRPDIKEYHKEMNTDLRHEHLTTLSNGAAEDTAQSREPGFGQDLLNRSSDDGVEGSPEYFPSMSNAPEPASK